MSRIDTQSQKAPELEFPIPRKSPYFILLSHISGAGRCRRCRHTSGVGNQVMIYAYPTVIALVAKSSHIRLLSACLDQVVTFLYGVNTTIII